jgi:hypothetical protein
MALYLFGPWPLFQFFNPYTPAVGLPGQGISPSQGRCSQTEQHKQNKRTQICMPRVGIKPKFPVFEPAKTVHALDHAANVIG